MGKIGVFDSGFGGLSILKEIVAILPQYDYVYLGDNARAPYGDKSQELILKYTKEGIDFLFALGAEIIILACNTASSEALRRIQQEYLPQRYPDKRVLGVIIPACEAAVASGSKSIGVLGTEATISSHAFQREILKLDPQAEVAEIAAPLLVPLVEAGEEESEAAKLLIGEYMHKLPALIDTLILGCTHYGFLEGEIRKIAPKLAIVSEGSVVALKFRDYLERHKDIKGALFNGGSVNFYTTDSKDIFDIHGTRFFKSEVRSQHIKLL
jgi:glutamate racemase